eukprot:6455163-Amphidinium_carterae.1
MLLRKTILLVYKSEDSNVCTSNRSHLVNAAGKSDGEKAASRGQQSKALFWENDPTSRWVTGGKTRCSHV